MKKTIKVFIALALAFLLAFSAGCSGGSSKQQSSKHSSVVKETEEPSEKPTEEETEEPTERPAEKEDEEESEEDEIEDADEDEDEDDAHSTFSDVDWESVPTNQFLLADSYHTMMTERHVSRLSLKQLNIAINEIYARHGMIFEDDDLQRYFESTTWYQGTVEPEDFSESWFNDVEQYNVEFLNDYYDRRESGEVQQYNGGSGGNSNNNNNNTPQYCRVCGGLGDCIYCGGTGNCQHCFGMREVTCIYCNHGKCGACFDGYVYKYVGLEVKKVACSVCHGYDRCQYCGGDSRMTCNYCNGRGTCSDCGGTRLCGACGGTGH